jgi:hypothetical protein
MALPRATPLPITAQGLQVASPDAHPGTSVFRSAINFNLITDGIVQLAIDHAGEIGNIQWVKEWWEDPAIVGESEQFPCFYIVPLYYDEVGADKVDKSRRYYSSRFMGDPLAQTTFPITVMAYYKYLDIRQPQRDVRNYGWNFYDIMLNELKTMVKIPGVKSTTPHIGWHVAGTNYIIQWWSLQLELTSIL